jgi:hypothetical protein
VVTAHVYRGVLKGTEDVVKARIGLALTFRAGEIIGIRAFRTFDEALEAAGLSE